MSHPEGYSISSELISAMSALNTEVTYQGPLKTEDGEVIYISTAEPLAEHAMEHMSSAFKIATTGMISDFSELRRVIYKLTKADYETWQRADNLLRSIESKL